MLTTWPAYLRFAGTIDPPFSWILFTLFSLFKNLLSYLLNSQVILATKTKNCYKYFTSPKDGALCFKKIIPFCSAACYRIFFILSACNGQKMSSQVQLPAKAEQAIPGARIIKIKQEKEDGQEAFEVQVLAGEKAWEIDVNDEGQILDKEENSGEDGEEENKEETVFNFDADAVDSFPKAGATRKPAKADSANGWCWPTPLRPVNPTCWRKPARKIPATILMWQSPNRPTLAISKSS